MGNGLINRTYVELKGLSNVANSYRALNIEMQKGASSPGRSATAAAAQVFHDAARAGVHVGPDQEHLRDQIVMAFDKNPESPNITRYVVMVAAKRRRYRNNKLNRRLGRVGKNYQDFGSFFWWVVLEFGLGYRPSYPFMRPAFDNNASRALDQFQTVFSERLPAAIAAASKG
jgi:HK97 gp10 family phage protein